MNNMIDLTCRRIKLTPEFQKNWNMSLHLFIKVWKTEHPFLCWATLSTTSLQSNSKSILWKFCSLSHESAWRRLHASASSCLGFLLCQAVFARMNVPWLSLMHNPIPKSCCWLNNAASMLHFNRPCDG